MVWNHRVVRHIYTDTTGNARTYFKIHEAYYPDVGESADSITHDGIAPHGETLEELREELHMMLRACNAPDVAYTDFFAPDCEYHLGEECDE